MHENGRDHNRDDDRRVEPAPPEIRARSGRCRVCAARRGRPVHAEMITHLGAYFRSVEAAAPAGTTRKTSGAVVICSPISRRDPARDPRRKARRMTAQQSGDVKVLFLAGKGRSGGTLLASLLGQIPGFFNIGRAQPLVGLRARAQPPVRMRTPRAGMRDVAAGPGRRRRAARGHGHPTARHQRASISRSVRRALAAPAAPARARSPHTRTGGRTSTATRPRARRFIERSRRSPVRVWSSTRHGCPSSRSGSAWFPTPTCAWRR